MAVYRPRAATVDAVQFTGASTTDLVKFLTFGTETINDITANVLTLITTEGNCVYAAGDYLVRAPNGRVYFCSRNMFAALFQGA